MTLVWRTFARPVTFSTCVRPSAQTPPELVASAGARGAYTWTAGKLSRADDKNVTDRTCPSHVPRIREEDEISGFEGVRSRPRNARARALRIVDFPYWFHQSNTWEARANDGTWLAVWQPTLPPAALGVWKRRVARCEMNEHLLRWKRPHPRRFPLQQVIAPCCTSRRKMRGEEAATRRSWVG